MGQHLATVTDHAQPPAAPASHKLKSPTETRTWHQPKQPVAPPTRIPVFVSGQGSLTGTVREVVVMADAPRPQNVPAAGENWTMPTRISGPYAVIFEPSVFPSVETKVFGLLAEIKANAGGTVPVIQSASS